MTDEERNVGAYYDTEIFTAEITRLQVEFPVEFGITSRLLRRWVPDGARVAEIGVGGGLYSELLAAKHCRLHLVDVSRKLLEYVAAKLPAECLLDVTCESAARLETLPDASFDVVLLLGPLYHLSAESDRRAAVSEAARILCPEGLLFAAAINRLCYIRDFFRTSPAEILSQQPFLRLHLEDGNLDPQHAPPIGFAHLTGVDEFRALFADRFNEHLLIGVESFTAPWQQSWNDLPPEAAEAWLDLVEQTAATSEGLGQADHFLYVGRKRAPHQFLGS